MVKKTETKITLKAPAKKARVDQKSSLPTGKPKGRPLKEMSDLNSHVPRLIITGRGQLDKRAMHALRLKPELFDRLKAVASGQNYLLVQVAIEQLCERLENTDEILVIRAEDLG